jgi:hypothetical protein
MLRKWLIMIPARAANAFRPRPPYLPSGSRDQPRPNRNQLLSCGFLRGGQPLRGDCDVGSIKADLDSRLDDHDSKLVDHDSQLADHDSRPGGKRLSAPPSAPLERESRSAEAKSRSTADAWLFARGQPLRANCDVGSATDTWPESNGGSRLQCNVVKT